MTEKLSALMDGELAREEAQNVIKSLGGDAEHRENWDAYHLIGACLRGEADSALPNTKHIACTDAIFARLAQEPTILAPAALKKPRLGEGRTRLALAMAASVVTVSAVTVVALKQQQGGTADPVKLVQQVAPQPIVNVSNTVAKPQDNNPRVNDYLLVHRQFANPSAFQQANLPQHRDPVVDPAKQASGR